VIGRLANGLSVSCINLHNSQIGVSERVFAIGEGLVIILENLLDLSCFFDTEVGIDVDRVQYFVELCGGLGKGDHIGQNSFILFVVVWYRRERYPNCLTFVKVDFMVANVDDVDIDDGSFGSMH